VLELSAFWNSSIISNLVLSDFTEVGWGKNIFAPGYFSLLPLKCET